MTACVMSIYQTCRELAGLTQEQAAEQLNTSVRTMARYESGEQAVPDDIAYQMVLLYDSPYLAVQHLRQVSQVAAGLLPPVTVLDLPRAAIRIINQVRRFADRHRERELLDIAEDGVIAPEERPLFDEIPGRAAGDGGGYHGAGAQRASFGHKKRTPRRWHSEAFCVQDLRRER